MVVAVVWCVGVEGGASSGAVLVLRRAHMRGADLCEQQEPPGTQLNRHVHVGQGLLLLDCQLEKATTESAIVPCTAALETRRKSWIEQEHPMPLLRRTEGHFTGLTALSKNPRMALHMTSGAHRPKPEQGGLQQAYE